MLKQEINCGKNSSQLQNNVPEEKQNQSTGWNVDWEKFLPACESILLIDSALRKTWFFKVIVTGKDGKKLSVH